MSLDKLAENFNREDVENSRLLLHQILGTGKILKDDVFSDQVQRAQVDVKANLFDEESIRELRKRLETIEKEVHKLCRAKERLINVVIYGNRQEQIAKLIEILEQWPQVNTVKATSNLDSLNGIIMKELPQLLLVTGIARKEDEENRFSQIEETFLGTSIVSINDTADLVPNDLIAHLKEKAFNC